MSIFSKHSGQVDVKWDSTRPMAPDNFWTVHPMNSLFCLEVPIHHYAEWYDYHPEVLKIVGDRNNSWKRVRNGVDLDYAEHKQKLMAYAIPPEIRMRATRQAQTIINASELRTRKQRVRNRQDGRLDRKKMSRLEMERISGRHDYEQWRPYERHVKMDAELPTIAILGAMHTEATNRGTESRAYVRGMMEMILSLKYACQVAGLPTFAAATQGRVYQNKFGSFIADQHPGAIHATQIFTLFTPTYQPSEKAYLPFMDAELWMRLKINLKATHIEYARLITAMSGYRAVGDGLLDYFGTGGGGIVVPFARKVWNADYVITVGNIHDKDTSDCHVDFEFGREADTQVSKVMKDLARFIQEMD